VLTGGSDATHLGRSLPGELDAKLPADTEVHWVRGPYAESPRLPAQPRLRWLVHDAPAGLGELMAQSNYALTVYGVSFFELLQYGIPTVVFSPYGEKDQPELERIKREDVAVVAADEHGAIAALGDLMSSRATAEAISLRVAGKIDGHGALRLAERVKALISQ
jgi:spore coat polysaccharide biosynthesis predicted glycosyltransferase SpsG